MFKFFLGNTSIYNGLFKFSLGLCSLILNPLDLVISVSSNIAYRGLFLLLDSFDCFQLFLSDFPKSIFLGLFCCNCTLRCTSSILTGFCRTFLCILLCHLRSFGRCIDCYYCLPKEIRIRLWIFRRRGWLTTYPDRDCNFIFGVS